MRRDHISSQFVVDKVVAFNIPCSPKVKLGQIRQPYSDHYLNEDHYLNGGPEAAGPFRTFHYNDVLPPTIPRHIGW